MESVMSNRPSRAHRCVLAAMLVAAAGSSLASAQTSVTWTGGAGDGNYSNPLNWSPNVVPINGGGVTYNVFVPFVSGRSTIYIDAASPSDIDVQDFTLADGVTFVLTPNRRFIVRDDATINGVVDARGIGTIFDSGTAVAGSSGARVRARDGAIAYLRTPSHSTAGNVYSDTLFLAENGSTVDLAGTTQFLYGAVSGRHTHTLRANISSVLDLSDVQILSSVSGQDDILDFSIDESSSVLLNSLQVIQANGNGSDFVRLSLGHNATMSAPQLVNAARVRTNFTFNGSFDAPNLVNLTQSQVQLTGNQAFTTGALSNIDGSVFYVAAGATYGSQVTATSYRSDAWYEILWNDATLFGADGAGSLLAMDSLANIRFGHGNGRRFQYITADNAGVVRFDGLTSLTTFDNEDDVLVVRARTGGEVLLPSLAAITMTGSTSNYVTFQPGSGVTQELPALTTANQTYFEPAVGGSVVAANLQSWTRSGLSLSAGTGTVDLGANISQADDTPVNVSGGRTFAGITDPSVSFHWRNYGYTLYSADGAGSTLDLSGVGSLRLGAGGGYNTHTISSTAGGMINFAALSSINIGVGGDDDVLNMVMTGGSAINLDALTTVASTGNGNDYLQLTTDSIFSLPALTTAARLRTSLSGAAAGVHAPNLTSLTQSVITLGAGQTFETGNAIAAFDHSIVNVSGGAVFSGVTDTAYTSNAHYRGLWSGATVFSADGAGSAVLLPSIESWTFGHGNGDLNYYVSASNGGTVDLSGLRSLAIFNGEDDDLYFQVAASGGTINLDSLQTITMSGNSYDRVQFDVGADQTQDLPSLTSAHRTYVNVNAGATFRAPLLSTFTHSVFTLSGGVDVDLTSLSNVDGSIFRVSGGSTLSGIADADYTYYASVPSLWSGATIFSADGLGSVLDASGIALLRSGSPNGRLGYTISATNGGLVNLSGLASITPHDGQDDVLNFSISGGGGIDLSSLADINIANSGNGNDYVQFTAAAGHVFELPSLVNARRTRYSLAAGSVFNAPVLTTLTESLVELDGDETFGHGMLSNIDGTSIRLSGGAVFDGVTDAAYSFYSQIYPLWSGGTIFSADGVDTALILPSIATLTYGQQGGRNVFTISATNRGTVDLSGLISIEPVSGEDDYLVFAPGAGSTLNLSALERIGQTASGSGYEFVYMNPAAGGVIDLPALTSARRTRYSLAAGTLFNAPNLASLTESSVVLTAPGTFNAPAITNLDSTIVRVSGGAQFGPAGDVFFEHNTYWEGFFNTANISLWSADGAGSLADLSGVGEFRLGWGWGNHTFRIGASNEGVIDLSGLTRISMMSGQDDDLAFDLTTGGTINLASLATIDLSGGNGNQSVTFNVGEGQTLELPALATFNSTTFNLAANSAVNAGALTSVGFWGLTLSDGRQFNTGGLTMIDNSQFHVRTGIQWGTLTGDVLATSYSTSGYRYANFTLFSAANAGSLLDLSSVASLDLAWNDQDGTVYASTISASDSGVVDLSGVVSLALPARGEDRIDFVQTTGGLINLASLDRITGAGRARFYGRDGADFTLPALTQASGVEFDLGVGSDLIAPNLVALNFSSIAVAADRLIEFGGLTNMDNSQFSVSSGAQWGVSTGDIAATSYSTAGHRYGNFAYFSASGIGSRLDLSSLVSLDLAWNDQDGSVYTGSINASLSGVVDLSGVRTITAPARGEDRVDLSLATGGSILLSSLQSVGGGGYLRFIAADGADFDLPSVTSLQNVRFELSAGSSFTAPVLESLNYTSLSLQPERTYDFGGIGNIDNTDVQNFSGRAWGVVTGDIDAQSYTRTGYRYGSGSIFGASGAGSVLDLSSIQTANFAWDDQDGNPYASVIAAANSGIVNLNGLVTLTTPVRGEDRVDFTIGTGGQIQLDALTSIGGGGAARFTAGDGADFNLPSLATIRNTQFYLGAGSDLLAPNLMTMNFSGIAIAPTNTVRMRLANADNSQIANNAGRAWGTSTGDFVATSYSTSGHRYGNFSYFSASGAGSTLDLSSLLLLDAAWNDQDGTAYAGNVTATNAGRVDLSRLRSIIAPARGEDRIDFIASQDGEMNFGSIRSITGGGQVRFRAETGGTMTFSDLYLPSGSSLITADLDSTVTVSRTLFMQGGAVTLAPNSTLNLLKHFSNNSTSETTLAAQFATISMAGTGTQFFEVAGLDLGPVTPGNNGNFGIGQLVIGQSGRASFVQLVDVYDNGNRGQRNNEAIYLFGLGGPDGLVLLGGSTLYLDNLNVYARENGQWVHLNALFGTSNSVIAYSGGFLHLPSPGGVAPLAIAGLFAARRRRSAR
jgi:hypothetical protein